MNTDNSMEQSSKNDELVQVEPIETSSVEKPESNNKLPIYLAITAFVLVAVLVTIGAVIFLNKENTDSDEKNDTSSEISADRERENDESVEELEEDSDTNENSESAVSGNNEAQQTENSENLGNGLSRYSNEFFSFNYPSDWVLDDSKVSSSNIIQVFETDPAKQSNGNFITNINVIFTETAGFDFSDQGCSDVADEVYSTFDGTFSSSEITSAKFLKLNGNDACEIVFENVFQDYEIEQTQYYFHDSDTGYSFIMTLSSESSSANKQEAQSIAESFEVI